MEIHAKTQNKESPHHCKKVGKEHRVVRSLKNAEIGDRGLDALGIWASGTNPFVVFKILIQILDLHTSLHCNTYHKLHRSNDHKHNKRIRTRDRLH